MSLSLKNNQVGNQLIGCQARRRRIFLYLLVLVRLGNSDFRGFWVSKSKKIGSLSLVIPPQICLSRVIPDLRP